MDYKEIQRWIDNKIERGGTSLFRSSSWNLIRIYETKYSLDRQLIRAIDYVKEKQNAEILVVGSAGLDYLIHLQFLTEKPVYGIDVSSSFVKFQAEKIKSIRESNNYDELEEKLGTHDISNFKTRYPYGHVTVWMPFEKLKESLDHIHPIKADAHTQPFDDETFDFIFFDCAMDYSPYPVEFFKDCIRSLKKGGHCFMEQYVFTKDIKVYGPLECLSKY